MSNPCPPRRRPALFCLKPLNQRARQVVVHPCNNHLASMLSDGTPVLEVGFHIRSASKHTLATLGRGNADIFVEGSSIAKIQCSFEIEATSGAIMLYDRSHAQTTQVFGDNATPFEYGRLRKVLVQKKLNTEIGMGGKRKDLVQFELEWYENSVGTAEMIKNRESIAQGWEENPRLARTIDESETVLPSQMITRIHTPGLQSLKMRYAKGDILGTGQFGEVYKAIDVDTGQLMAVKILKRTAAKSKEDWQLSVYYALKREVEVLSRISHPHIVNYIASQGWDGPAVEIFMGLKDGSLKSLVTGGSFPCMNETLAWSIFHQMLQALDCLAANGIVHRDVKPENILYISLLHGEFLFQLGDFGLCNRAVSAVTRVGTPIYQAPEVRQRAEQTDKMDVWSLFVTMAWTLDVDGFRLKSERFQSEQQLEQVILAVAASPKMDRIEAMARSDPAMRASAAQMLVKCFEGRGLSTPQNEIPPIGDPANVKPEPPQDQLHIRKPRQNQALRQDGTATNRQGGEPYTRRRPSPWGVNPTGFKPDNPWRVRKNKWRLPPPP